MDNQWHLDKRIPVAIIVAIIIQSAVAGVWIGTTQSRVAVLERNQDRNSITIEALREYRSSAVERLARVEESSRAMKDVLDRIDKRVEQLTRH